MKELKSLHTFELRLDSDSELEGFSTDELKNIKKLTLKPLYVKETVRGKICDLFKKTGELENLRELELSNINYFFENQEICEGLEKLKKNGCKVSYL